MTMPLIDVSEFSPIALFTFSRPDHTRRTLQALATNELAKQSDLIVYSDAARNVTEVGAVNDVRMLVKNAKGFRTVTVIERNNNYGLARNIIEGVTEVCNQHGRVIVLEDDIVTSPQFLTFMNASLNKYANEPRVWHISGWNYPIEQKGLGDAFFWRMMNCWGWATWADCWQHFRKDSKYFIKTWDKEKIYRFNLDGAYDFWSHIGLNEKGKLNTWAIFWYATIFDNNGLSLNPVRPYVLNIGHDGTGENCSKNNFFQSISLNNEMIRTFPKDVKENIFVRSLIKQYYTKSRPPIIIKLLNGIRCILRLF